MSWDALCLGRLSVRGGSVSGRLGIWGGLVSAETKRAVCLGSWGMGVWNVKRLVLWEGGETLTRMQGQMELVRKIGYGCKGGNGKGGK